MTTENQKKSLPVSFRLNAELKAALEQMAMRDSRSVSSFLEQLIIERARKEKLLPKGFK